jgi:hypothetical protein
MIPIRTGYDPFPENVFPEIIAAEPVSYRPYDPLFEIVFPVIVSEPLP